jgi:hypothetical protein
LDLDGASASRAFTQQQVEYGRQQELDTFVASLLNLDQSDEAEQQEEAPAPTTWCQYKK